MSDGNMPTTAGTQAEDELRRLVRQKAGLTRVATIVAEGVPAAELFAALAQEVVQALEVPAASLVRYEADGSTVVLASLNAPDFPVGGRSPLDGNSLSARVLETGGPARIESELRSEVGVPIVVDGVVWGLIRAGATGHEPLSADIEASLRDFTELVATAISKNESRESLRRVVAEQAALRTVATLVAEGAPPAEVFSCVAQEVARVLDVSAVSIMRFDSVTWSVVVASFNDPGYPVGSRWPLQGQSLIATVFTTGQPAQIEYSELSGRVADVARSDGLQVGVGVPIVVEGRVWGMIAVGQRDRRDALPAFAGSYTGRLVLSATSPEETQARLAAFTELIATAIANAEARTEVQQLADEQAALRRVATLVAKEDLPEKLFTEVAEETGGLLGSVECTLLRLERDGAATNIGSWGEEISAVFPLGTRFRPDGDGVAATVLRTGQPHRIDDYSAVTDPIARSARDRGTASSVGCPILVRGAIWGAIVVGTTEAEPFPPETEMRLTQFADLVATAVANAETRREIVRLADDQAALRRVATLVAEEVAPDRIFSTACEQVGHLLEADHTALEIFPGDGTAALIAAWSSDGHSVPIGQQFPLEPGTLAARIVSTHRPARRDGYEDADIKVGPFGRDLQLKATVGAPILVGGQLWGALMAGTGRGDPWAEEAEIRLAAFTELVATAITNAESRAALAKLADEQAALRRVATLVARDAPQGEVFDAVAMEVGTLLDTDITVVGRYDSDGAATAIGGWSASPGGVPVGTRSALGGRNVLTLVAETSRPARVDGYDDTSGEAAEIARRHGWRSSIAAPIIVEGRLWGVMLVATKRAEPFPAAAEERLAAFTDLVATALDNAQAHDEVRRFGEEQAALGRVATLVAEGVQPDAIFSAVGQEVARLFRSSVSTIGRFAAGADAPLLVIVGVGTGGEMIPIGSRWELEGPVPSAQVFHTGRSVRIDKMDWSAVPGAIAEVGSRLGIVSTVASPIFVERRLWGVITVSDDKQLPAESEERLKKFSELIATAIANAESSAELAASRRRIVAAADEARRRIERDLHDGIQQRLIALTFRARAMTRRPREELPGIAAELSEGLKDVSEELREISRGIHPTILTEAGLGPALRALARRSSVPTDVDVKLDERLPTPVEVAAYYIASEALTNVAKHSDASVVQLIVAQNNGVLTLEIRDDGVGGVDPDRGSGILGLTDRVEALGGTISISSPPGAGTTIAVELPTAGSVTP